MSGLERLVAPAEEPLSLAEAKAHLRLETAEDDALVAALVAAARGALEAALGRALVTQTWRLWRDGWPLAPALPLPRPPLVAVAEIATVDRDGAEHVVAAGDYLVDPHAEPGRVIFRTRTAPVALREANGLRIDFTAGYGDAAAVPMALRQAVRLLVAHFYERREPAEQGDARLPAAVAALLAPYRIHRL